MLIELLKFDLCFPGIFVPCSENEGVLVREAEHCSERNLNSLLIDSWREHLCIPKGCRGQAFRNVACVLESSTPISRWLDLEASTLKVFHCMRRDSHHQHKESTVKLDKRY